MVCGSLPVIPECGSGFGESERIVEVKPSVWCADSLMKMSPSQSVSMRIWVGRMFPEIRALHWFQTWVSAARVDWYLEV